MVSADQFFEGVEQEQDVKRSDKPFWTLPLDKPEFEKDVHNWLIGELEYLQTENQPRFLRIQKNLALYKGIQYSTQETRSGRDVDGIKKNPVQKIVTNDVFDLIENRTSKLVKYRPAVSVMPGNEDQSAKIGAKACDYLIQHIQDQARFDDDIVPETVGNAQVMDECYLFVEWNPDKGDLHPAYKAAMHTYSDGDNVKIPLLDDSGNPQLDDSGSPIMIEKPVHIGDVDYQIVLSTDVLLEKKERLSKVNYVFRREVMHVEEARARWPESADKIKSAGTSKGGTIYDYEKMEARTLKNEVVVWRLDHKRSKFLPKGRRIYFTLDGILESKEFPYSHSKLPFCRLPGIHHPGELHTRSVIEKIKGLTGATNNILNMIVKNAILCAHPKWMMPAGSAKIDSLGNDITVVQFKGPQPPQLVQSNPVAPVLFELLGKLKEESQQKAGVGGVARGEPPPGIKAGVALQFLQELESERNNAMVLSFNAWVREVAQMTLDVASDFYDESDQRMIRIMGKTGKWMSMNFDIKHLAQKYEIRIQNSSALPQQRSARTQYLLDLAENPAFAGLLPPEQVLDMLDLGQSDKFIDAATVSTRAAEAENDAIMDGKEVKEPETYEDHMKHWPIHVRQLQDWAFKNETDPKIQDALKEHIMTTEHLMVEKAKQNPGYMQMLLALPNFPVVYTPDTQAADAGGMGGVPGGMPSGGMGGGAMDAPMPDGQTLSQGGSGGPQDAAAFQSKPEGSIPPGEPQSQPAPSVQDQINQNH